MFRKDCPQCGNSSFSAAGSGATWICPYCGLELIKEPLKNTDGSPVKFNDLDPVEKNNRKYD
ncbi:hypothetical protein Psfp_02361 [Pelotomaculum sp. FP]|uniref:hypothetical protein n=1 Tax=Pelotomaculum sp. FP TaxID=261474 RepID=UPI0010649FF8|nr:hypothetical protein [Pelotomaculum sp. FP]TEB15185.1 hypothetical protein Psfp_02361 [Pelotomaculum sp. FP]